MRVPIKFRKAGLLTKLLLLAIVIFAVTTLVGLQGQIAQATETVAELQDRVAVAEQEHLAVEDDIAQLGTPESNAKIARERLRMLYDGEYIFINKDN